MRLRDPRIWLGLLTAIAVASIAVADLGRTSPGPLARVHADVEELHGGNRCAGCHGGWFSDLQHACAECHDDVAQQVAAATGLHGSFGAARAQNCGTCHSEHHGADFAIVNRATWAQAGVADVAAFDHARLGFAFDGRHLELPCARCHQHADAAPLPAGAKRFLGLQRDCKSCHDDVHQGAMAVRCDQCHGQRSWSEPASTGHDRFLPLQGGHGALACTECHAEGTPRAVKAIGATGARDPRTCTDCHTSPHRAGLLAMAPPAAPAAEARALPDRARHAACADCHQPEHLAFADARAAMTPARHSATGFALEPPHAEVACEQCHAAAGTFAARHPGRGATACAACHADPHGGQFQGLALAQDGCRSCHAVEHFAPHAFSLAMHARTALPLEGKHATTACDSCHDKPAPELARRFHGIATRCDECHRDAHDGAFAAHGDELATARGGSCGACHDSDAFANAGKAFDHARFTPLPLDGAHAQVGCDACHPDSDAPDASGRTFGKVRTEHGAFRGCATCHEDPHQGRFDRAGLPTEQDGRRDCARCHGTASFRVLPTRFDHQLWTGFPLHGAHAQVGCGECHPAGDPSQDAHGMPAARGRDCGDCHQEPHAGQFALGATTDCRRCHRAAATFQDLTFRHDLDARFALGEAHTGVACARCHATETVAGQPVVRYRPVPRECTDCHDQPQDPLRRRTRDRDERGGLR